VAETNPTEQEMIERGKQVFEDCYRGVVPMPPSVDPKAFTGMTMKMFNDFWGGIEQLSMRDKRMIILGGLLSHGRADMFTIHAECALRNGEMDANELRGVVLMALPYIGFPNASVCMLASETVIAKVAKEKAA
jgi:4-carboxymuconolactone decarboxylase